MKFEPGELLDSVQLYFLYTPVHNLFFMDNNGKPLTHTIKKGGMYNTSTVLHVPPLLEEMGTNLLTRERIY